jgi:hypothetical protein
MFLIQIRNSRNNSDAFTVRTGYFGICAGSAKDLFCSNTGQGVGNWSSVDKVPSNLRPFVEFGIQMQKNIFFPWIMVLSAGLFFLAVVTTILKQLSFGKRPLLDKIITASFSVTLVLTLLSTISISHARKALALTTSVLPTSFVITTGLSVFILHWLVLGFVAMLLLLHFFNAPSATIFLKKKRANAKLDAAAAL